MTTLAGLPTLQGYSGEPMIDYDKVEFLGLEGEITAEDIDFGTPKNCGRCPVARAVGRMFPDCQVRVDSFMIIIRRRCLAYSKTFSVSPALRVWIGDYDGSEPCEPKALVIRKDVGTRDFMFDISTKITIDYHDGGLHLITGKCVAICAGFESEDGAGEYTLKSDEGVEYCVYLNLPEGFHPPKKYPAIGDGVICQAACIERNEIADGRPAFNGYSEHCRVADTEKIHKARQRFAEAIDPTRTQDFLF